MPKQYSRIKKTFEFKLYLRDERHSKRVVRCRLVSKKSNSGWTINSIAWASEMVSTKGHIIVRGFASKKQIRLLV